jgi:hypothetical protein
MWIRSISTILITAALAAAPAASVQKSNVVTREDVVTARVDRIEKGPRLVTLKTRDNIQQTVHVDPSLAIFDELKVGDTVTVRYVESTIVAVKPQAALSKPRDTTDEARRAGKKDVIAEEKAVVVIEGFDSQRLFVTFRWENGSRMVRAVSDPRLVEGLRVGDRVEVTLTRERAISVTRR